MIKVFNSQQEFSNYTQGGMNAGDLYYVKENKSIHFRTNNIDNVDTDYHMEASPVLIEGLFTDNGTYQPDNADGYNAVVVDVDKGSGTILIKGQFSENGTYIPDNADGYNEVVINVPIPDGYIVPSGTKTISENGTSIDVTNYANVDVNVSGGSQPVYTDATISDASPILCSLNAGETIDVYNLNHANVKIMISDIATGVDSYAPSGTYEHLYYTAGDVNDIQSEGVYVQIVNGTTGSSAIKYRIFN
jgi:hypothetical protein